MVGPHTRVIPLQNGIDSYETVAPIVGVGNTAAGVTYVATVIDRPGVIRQDGTFQSIIFGRVDGRPDAQLQAFADACKSAGIAATHSDNIQRDRWHKYIFLTATSGSTAVTRMTMGSIMADPDTRRMFYNIMRETLKVGQAKGVALEDNYLDQRMEFADKSVPAVMKASMANDLDRGNRLELDWLAGTVSRLGKELNVPTPVNDTIYAALKLHRMGKR
jgi:2-dehydropantoate 2-reductase